MVFRLGAVGAEPAGQAFQVFETGGGIQVQVVFQVCPELALADPADLDREDQIQHIAQPLDHLGIRGQVR